MGSFARSLALARASLQVLQGDRELAIFTVLSGGCTLAAVLLFAMPAFALGLLRPGSEGGVDSSSPLSWVLLFACYAVVSFITLFFNTALIGTALDRMRGGHATMAEGFAIAERNVGHIFLFALISATVGVVLRAFEGRRSGLIGQIIGRTLGAAWAIATFLVVPVMVAEGANPWEAMTRSTRLLKRTWGEQIIGNAGIGFVFFLLSLLAVVPFLAGVYLQTVWTMLLGAAIGVIYFCLLLLLATTLSQIYRAAVYLYAQTGTVPSQFEGWVLTDAFRSQSG